MNMVKLAFIRNELFQGRVCDEYLQTLVEIKDIVAKESNLCEGLITLCINNALEYVAANEHKLAAGEVNFIHNIPIGSRGKWDQDYFFTSDLLEYLEKTSDTNKIKRALKEIAKFC